jgi:prolyl-tRNA editing enzyme YbaK/EbsC (Cys-tRNA(Pro) deacylase)
MWPPEVERVAALLRAAGVEGRLEEIPAEELGAPGPAVRAEAYECDGRTIVAVIPDDRDLDLAKLSTAAGCTALRRLTTSPRFPYANTSVLIDRLVFGEHMVWVEAGSERHVAGLAPAHLVELTHARSANLVADA